MRNTNRQWRLRRHPEGMPRLADWELAEVPLPEPGEGELLARAIYADVAPYMRGRISGARNYADGVQPGEVMVGGAVAEVVRSGIAGYAPGDLVVSDFAFGWQDYAVLDESRFRRIDTALAPPETWLDMMGLNGITAYFGLYECAAMRASDTVVVSAAAGSVGQLVGQLAAIGGGRAIAVTSTPDKLAWCRELGFADGLAYREDTDLVAALKRLCPEGVDLFFDNTAGPIHDAVMQNLAQGARITICGQVSRAGSFDEPDLGPRFLRQLMVARATMRGFLVLDYAPRYDLARQRLAAWYRAGRLQTRYDIVNGLERLPEAFLRILGSGNTGKQLVRVGEIGSSP